MMVEWRQQGADMPSGAETEGSHLELQVGSREGTRNGKGL